MRAAVGVTRADKALGGLHSENMVGDTKEKSLSAAVESCRQPGVFIAVVAWR